MKIRLRLFGLRMGRFRQWWHVIGQTNDGAGPTVRQWVKMAALVLNSARKPRAAGSRERIRAAYGKCLRCPFHDARFHTCLGCFCYMPLKIVAGGKCWAKEQDPASTLGF